MMQNKIAGIFLAAILSAVVQGQELKLVETYEQDELLKLIASNSHLERVKSDRCQLNKDIEANATVLKIPAYQFLWGDMLAWGVCVSADPALGLVYIQDAAHQGLPEAHEQLGRYYDLGILVTKNIQKSIRHLSVAAYSGNVSALLRLTDIFLRDAGSPVDFEDTYRLLCSVVSDDKSVLQQVENRKTLLAKRLPKSVINKIHLATDRLGR